MSHWDYYQTAGHSDLTDDAAAHRRFYDEYNAVPMPGRVPPHCAGVPEITCCRAGLWDVAGERVDPSKIKTAR